MLRSYRPSPKNDIFIRYLFGSEGHENMLLSFINAVNDDKGRQRMTEVTILNPYNVRENYLDKESIIDIKAKAEDGSYYNIEVQLVNKGMFAERSLYYWARIYGSQLADGEKYWLLKPVTCINLIDFRLPDNKSGLHTTYSIMENVQYNRLSNHLTIDFIELPRIDECPKINGVLLEWLHFFSTPEDKLHMADFHDPEVQQAIKTYQKFMADPQLREAYEAHHKAMLDYNSMMWEAQTAKERGYNAGFEEGQEKGLEEGLTKGLEEGLTKGLEEGLTKGREEGLAEGLTKGREEGLQNTKKALITVAKNLAAGGMSTADILKATGLSTDEWPQ